MSSPASPDAILETIAFWISVFAAIYFFKKGKRVAGWVSVASAILLPVLVGLFFASTSQEQVLQLKTRQPVATSVATRPALQDAPQSLTEARHKERRDVTNGSILNPEYDSKLVTIDKSDRSLLWDSVRWQDGSSVNYAYVEKVNERGELVVSVVIGSGNQKILNLFHVAPIYGTYSTILSSGLDDCQKTRQIRYLQQNIVGKMIRINIYNETDVPLCDLSPRLYYPQLLASLQTDGQDGKFVIGKVSLVDTDAISDTQHPLTARSLTDLLAESGYLQADRTIPGCENPPELKRAIEIAKVKQNGFWGACK